MSYFGTLESYIFQGGLYESDRNWTKCLSDNEILLAREINERIIPDLAEDGLFICDFNGNVIAKIDKNGVESVDFTAGGKKLSEMTNSGGGGGCTNDIIEHPAYNDSLMINYTRLDCPTYIYRLLYVCRAMNAINVLDL